MKEKDNTKEYTEGIAIKGGFLGWLDNFWYHYKWPTIITAFFLIVLIVCIAQSCNKEENDIVVLYAGSAELNAQDSENISRVIESIMPADRDKNGNKNAMLVKYNILSEDQQKELSSQRHEDGTPVFVDNSYYTSEYKAYSNYIMTGESSIVMLERWIFDELVANNRIATLESVLGYVPDGAVNEYGVSLGALDIYADFGVLAKLPSDTVVCVLHPNQDWFLLQSKNGKEEYYSFEKSVFKAIVEYKTEGEEN